MNLITRVPQWLRNYFGLTEPEMPTQLATDYIRGVIDVAQGGWGDATWTHVTVTQGAGTAAQTLTLIESSSTLTRVVLAMEAFHSGGAAAAELEVIYREPVQNLSVRRLQQSFAVGARDPFTIDFDYLRLPPGLDLRISFPATAAGETISVGAIVGTMRSGVKP